MKGKATSSATSLHHSSEQEAHETSPHAKMKRKERRDASYDADRPVQGTGLDGVADDASWEVPGEVDLSSSDLEDWLDKHGI